MWCTIIKKIRRLKYNNAGLFSKLPALNDTFEPVWIQLKEHLNLLCGNVANQSIKYIVSLLFPLIFCVEFKYALHIFDIIYPCVPLIWYF